MIWAVFNIHSPARLIDADGCGRIGDGPILQMSDPIFTSQSREEAEEERLSRLSAFKSRTLQRNRK